MREINRNKYPPLNSIYLKLFHVSKPVNESNKIHIQNNDAEVAHENLSFEMSDRFHQHLKGLVLDESLSNSSNHYVERGSLYTIIWDFKADAPSNIPLDPTSTDNHFDSSSVWKLYAKIMAVKPFSRGIPVSEMTSIVLLDVTPEGQAKLDWIDDDRSSANSLGAINISRLRIFNSCRVSCIPISFDPFKYRYPQIEQKLISKMAAEILESCDHDSFAVCSYDFLELHHLFHGDWVWLLYQSKKRKCQLFASDDLVSLVQSNTSAYSSLGPNLFVHADLLYNVISPSLLDQHDKSQDSILSVLSNNENHDLNLIMQVVAKECEKENRKALQKVEFKRRADPLDGLVFDSACKALTRFLKTRKVYVGLGDVIRVQVDLTKSHFERMMKSRSKILEENASLLDQILSFNENRVSIPYYFSATLIQSDGLKLENDETIGCIDSTSTIVSINPEPFIPVLALEYPYTFLDNIHFLNEVDEKDKVEAEMIDLFRMSLHADAQMTPSILLVSPEMFSKRQTNEVISKVARETGFQIVEIDCNLLLNETNIVITAMLESSLEKTLFCSPCILIFHRIDMVAKKSSTVIPIIKSSLSLIFQKMAASGKALVLLATSSKKEIYDLDAGILGVFETTLYLSMPDQKSRVTIVNKLTRGTRLEDNYIDSASISVATAGLSEDDLHACFANAGSFCFERVTNCIQQVSPFYENDSELLKNVFPLTGLSNQDIQKALTKARAHHSETIGAPKIPKVLWSDIGGLEHVKDTILETIQLPMMHPELFQSGAKKRSGILLYGPPGTGKTLIAKAVATSLSLNFLSVKGPELLNMYIGESEHNVRRVFEKARDARPCIIFFDEMESVAPARGEKGDSGGVMDRIVSQLLAEIDGMNKGGNGDIFVIGATNRPDLLDPALLRPGRFDKMLYLGVCSDHKAQTLLLKALTRKFNLADDFDFGLVADQCPLTLTGADIYALCTDANLKAISRVISVVDEQLNEWNLSGPHQGHPFPASMPYFLDHICDPELYNVLVTLTDFEDALGELQPSLSREELERYEKLRSKFEGISAIAPVIDRKGKGKAV